MMRLARLPFPRWVAAVTAAALVCGLLGWRYFYRERPLATLERALGSVARDYHAELGRWQAAERGASFAFGDGVKTGPASEATLALFDSSTLKLEPKTTVRFLDRPPAGSQRARFDVLLGGATLEADQAALEVEFALGGARLEPHTKLHLTPGVAGLKVEVTVGSARLLGSGESLELQVGDAVEIMPDRTFRRLTDPEPQAAAPASARASAAVEAAAAVDATAGAGEPLAPSEKPTSDAAAGTKAAAGLPRGPESVDLTATPGDSFVIHDPAPPSAVGFGTAGCPSGAARLTLASSHGAARETFGERPTRRP